MCATTTTHLLPVSTEAPARARRIVYTVGELASYPDVRFAAQVLVSELTANCVRHAGLRDDQPISLSVECDEEILWVEVADDGPGFDALSFLRRHWNSQERYHGIFLINALADRWGYRCAGVGCVWFEIDLVPGRRPWRGRKPISEDARRSPGGR